MNKSEIIRYLILRSIGNFLVLFAIFGVLATFGPAAYYEISFKIVQARGVHYRVYEPKDTTSPLGEILKQQKIGSVKVYSGGFADVLAGPKEQILIPNDTSFDILIPKLGANAKVFPNVDASDENQFLPVLKQGVAHAKGTVFPGMKGNIYLFAHSTDNFWDVGRYNAIFYLLKDLLPGDDVVIFFQNKRYNYVVTGSKTVDPSDVSYIVNAQNQKSETLILQTCWPPGTTWKRWLVFAKPK
ncbi:MAG: sortase [Patescibacteria group bacterium]|nr:sortase [Patescibacteria group bacterium]